MRLTDFAEIHDVVFVGPSIAPEAAGTYDSLNC